MYSFLSFNLQVAGILYRQVRKAKRKQDIDAAFYLQQCVEQNKLHGL